MKMGRKRGLSPVVATVLLIALAMILAMIIFLWARGWIFEQIEKKGAPIDQVCESVKIRVDSYPQAAGEISITVVNLGPVGINSLEIRQEGATSSTPAVWNVSIPQLGTSSPKIISFSEGVERIIVYPQLMGNIKGKQDSKITTCLNSGQTIDIK